VPRDADRNYVIVRGTDADRHVKLLIQFAVEGSLSGAYSQSETVRRPDTLHRESDPAAVLTGC